MTARDGGSADLSAPVRPGGALEPVLQAMAPADRPRSVNLRILTH
jgi:hypothetical protein